MARTVSLLQLRTRVRQRANMEGSQFVTDNELTDNINESVAELYDLLVAARGQEYYRNSYSFSTVNGTVAYNLPDDFYQLISVDIDLGGGADFLSARPYMEVERNMYRTYPAWSYGNPVMYRLQANTISFIPTPSGAYTVTLHYIPTSGLLEADTDTVDGVSGWEEYVVVDAAMKCLQKEESDVSLLMAQKQALLARIQGMAGSRDSGAPERASDRQRGDVWGDW